MSMDHEDSATLTPLSVRSAHSYHRGEERNSLPGCFLTSGACFTPALLNLVRQLHSGSPLSLTRSNPDGCAPAWKAGDRQEQQHRLTWPLQPRSIGGRPGVPGVPRVTLRESSDCLLFSGLHEPRGELSDVPGAHSTGVG